MKSRRVSTLRLSKLAAIASIAASTLLFAAGARTARAHGLEPALLALRETSPGIFEVTWKSAAQRLPGADVQPTLPGSCKPVTPIDVEDGGDRVRLRWSIDCGPGGLAGGEVGVSDLDVAKITALVRVELRDGTISQGVLNESQPEWRIPARESATTAAASFLRLGLRHVLSGADHVLLVAALLLLVGSARELLVVAASFAIGEGLALGPAVLGATALPSPVASLLLAACLLAIATSLARREDGSRTGRRLPTWAVGLFAGLVQGASFAGALGSAGLRVAGAPVEWLGFQAGLLVGQVAVASTLLGLRLAASEPLARVPFARRAAILATGVLAAYWCLERVAPWVG